MQLQIEHQRSNFSQFSDNLWLVAVTDDTRIKFDVDQDELLDFALHLIDVADDCLRKSEMDTDDAETILSNASNAISDLNDKKSETP